MESILYYFHDPMCSWCYAFHPVWTKIKTQLPQEIVVESVLGGLAPDSDDPMPEELQRYIQGCWHRIQAVVPGTVFNFDYWQQCRPRRSTYPACRAVIAARALGEENDERMLQAIYQAYFREARNPSDENTHIQLAGELGLDTEKYAQALVAGETHAELMRQIAFTQSMGVSGFPTLAFKYHDQFYHIPHDYNDSQPVLDNIDHIRRVYNRGQTTVFN